MKKKVSILIPDGEGGLALKVLRCLAQVPDIKISILSRKRWSPIRFSRYRSGFLSHNKDSFDKNRLDAILHAANKVGADVIFPVDQDTIQLIAAHKEEVTSVAALPPIATLEQMNTSGDKWLLAKVLQKNNIPLPSTVFYEKNKTNKNDFAHLSFPVVTKPLVGAGGTGINFFANQDELTKYLDTEEGNHKLLIQSFIHGYDIGSAVLCRDEKY